MNVLIPIFLPDIERVIKKDNFYTSVLQNKLTWETCRSLKGHCQKICRPPIPAEKGRLVKMYFKGPMTRKIFIPLSDEEYQINNSGDSLSAST